MCILVSTLSVLLWSHINEYSPVLQDLHEDHQTLCLTSIRIHRPCTYHKRCGLNNLFPFLLLGRICGPGTTCSPKPTVFLKSCTFKKINPSHCLTTALSYIFAAPISPASAPTASRASLLRAVPWAPRKSRTPSLLPSSAYRIVWPIGPYLLSSSCYHMTQLRLSFTL